MSRNLLKYLFLLLLFQVAVFAGTLANLDTIQNGTSTTFSKTATDNYFMFTMNEKGNILLSGSDGYNYAIDQVKLYDTDLNLVKSWSNVQSGTSTTIEVGTYIVQPVDGDGGSFSIYSKGIDNFDNFASMKTIQNGTSTTFSKTATDNYFMFTMNEKGNILLSGSDGYNHDIDQVKLYDTDLNLVKSWSYVQSGTSATIEAGTYIVQPVDTQGGTFSIYSKGIDNFDNFASMKTIQNGTATTFSKTATDNYFMFTMNEKGNILLSGSDGYNSYIDEVKVYDTDLNLVKSWSYVQSGTSATIEAGTYIVQPVDGNGGSFSIYSNKMSDSITILQDDDNDGVININDAFPNDPAASKDTDKDGKPDSWNDGYTQSDSTTGLVLDDDIDGDGVLNKNDAFPNDPAASIDEDKDGKPDKWNDGYNKDDSTTKLVLDDDVLIVTNLGNLIILTGDSDNTKDPLYIASQKLSKTFYHRFTQRGMSDEDIYWLNYNSAIDIDNDGVNDNVVDTSSFGKAKFYDTIKTWAKDTNKTGPLYIYMVDHGANGAFKISSKDKDGDGSKEIVYSSELVSAVDSFIDETSRDVYIIIEACKSGSFIPMFQNSSNSDKIAVIASSQAGKFSYIDAFGNVSFTKFLADELLSGKTMHKAYEDAVTKLNNQGGVYAKQTPMIYASTDALKNSSVGGSFSIAGISLITIDNIYIDSVEDNTNIDLTNKKNIKINAKITANSGISKVWTTVIPPDFSTILDDNFTTPDLAPYTKELSFNSQTQQFETTWDILSSKTYSGDYKITVYAEDNDGLVYSKNITAIGSGQEDFVDDTVVTENNSTTKIKNLTLTNGWNLVSLPVDMNLSQSDIKIKFPNAKTLWTYAGGKWSAYSSNTAIQNKINSANIATITSISKGDGFWVNNDGMEQIKFNGNSYDILSNSKLTDTTAGWKLLGSGSNIDVSKLNTVNSNINVVWSYNSGKWSAYSQNQAIKTLINKANLGIIDTISQGAGFWVNVK